MSDGNAFDNATREKYSMKNVLLSALHLPNKFEHYNRNIFVLRLPHMELKKVKEIRQIIPYVNKEVFRNINSSDYQEPTLLKVFIISFGNLKITARKKYRTARPLREPFVYVDGNRRVRVNRTTVVIVNKFGGVRVLLRGLDTYL